MSRRQGDLKVIADGRPRPDLGQAGYDDTHRPDRLRGLRHPTPDGDLLLDDGMAMLLAAVILLVLRSEFSRP